MGVYLYMLSRGREQASLRRSLGITVALSGVAVLLVGRGLAAASGPLVGDLLILVAVVAWVFYTAEGRELIARHGPIRASAWTMTAASLLMLPAMPFMFHPVHLIQQVSSTALMMVLYLGLVTSVVAYLLWYFALSRLEASRVAVFSNLQPAATALASWVVLADPVTWEIFVGGALVIWGVRVAQRRDRAPTPVVLSPEAGR
jgi:drug/metabolite transporter (DMT)-like permease